MRLHRGRPGGGSPEPGDAGGLERRLAWIFGSPRSGSTWLLRLLAYPLEPALTGSTGARRPRGRRRVAARVVPIDEPYLPQHLTPLVPVAGDPADMSKPTSTTLNATRGDDPNHLFSPLYADAWRPPLRSLILSRFAAQVTRAADEHGVRDPLAVVKEPNGSHGAELVMSLLPESRLIFLVRDGRDVVDSFIDAMSGEGWLAGRPGLPRLDDPERRLAFARSESRAWVDRTEAVERAFRAHSPELRYSLRYEDLRADTEGVLSPLLDWLGVERSDAELRAGVADNAFESIPAGQRGRGTQWRAASPGLWRENLTGAEQRGMREIMAPKLTALGYEP